tara:strand:+ start:2597 stop:2911 length:315 start_codon:yes stop_codon:yes gene_type:complete
MEYSSSSGSSQLYINGKPIDNISFNTQSDGDITEYYINDNNNISSGVIPNLKEEQLMELLNYPANKNSLIQQLEKDFPLNTRKITRKKVAKHTKSKKSRRRKKL